MKALEEMRVPYRVVIEEQEYPQYASVIDKKKLLVLDLSYKEKYELCDEFGLTKSTGSGPARNFIWDHSIAEGHKWHWIMDDNIRIFYRLDKNRKIPFGDGTCFKAMEDFVERYENIAMAGPHYAFFAPRKEKHPPFITNTRIYSCNLIRNDLPFRWRGRYNEDTILSLDLLKAGWCTIIFYAFLQDKMNTQSMKGGNTTELYAKDGTLPKSQMLVREHPDVSRLTYKYGRWHHYVDYRPFQKNKLIRRKDFDLSAIPEVDEYGLTVHKKPAKELTV